MRQENLPQITRLADLRLKKRLFSRSSGWKGERNTLRPGGASRSWRDRISGNSPDSGAVAWVPRGTCSRSPCGKQNPCYGPAHKIIIRREPMKEQPLHYVQPGAGCTPGAPPESPNEHAFRRKIRGNHPLDWEKTQKRYRSSNCSQVIPGGTNNPNSRPLANKALSSPLSTPFLILSSSSWGGIFLRLQ